MLFETNASTDCFLPRRNAYELGFEPNSLLNLIQAAEFTQTDALIIIKDGFFVVERYFNHSNEPIELMSITKSIASLSIGFLIADDKIASIDTPIATWFPEWNEGRKSKITLRHVLTHTSGIEHDESAMAISRQADQLKYARERGAVEEPGTCFAYNNEAIQLLGGIVYLAAGLPLDIYLEQKLFEPLGISSWIWKKDSVGNVQVFSGLSLNAQDLARIGIFMLNQGKWQNKALLPEQCVIQFISPNSTITPFYGLLWWLRQEAWNYMQTPERLEDIEMQGFAAANKLKILLNQSYTQPEAYWLEAGSLLTSEERLQLIELYNKGISPLQTKLLHPRGFYADGWLGQRLIIYPKWNLIAVRLHRAIAGGGVPENDQYSFPSFFEKLEAAIQS